MHIGSVGIFEGPAPEQDRSSRGRGQAHLVPRYRQKVRFLPLALGRPIWVDDSHFNLDYHVRRTALPAPGGDEELRNLVGRVMSQQLDRAKPLWEMWVVEGLEDGRWALITKIHHCMVDGVSGTDLLSVLLTTSAGAAAETDAWEPAPEPSSPRITPRAGPPCGEPVRGARAACCRPRAAATGGGQAAELARAVSSLRTLLRPTPGTSLNGPIGPHRRWAGRGRACPTSSRSATELGAPSTTSCSPRSPRLPRPAARRGEPVEGRACGRSCPSRCAAGRAGDLQQQGLCDVRRAARSASRTRPIASRCTSQMQA